MARPSPLNRPQTGLAAAPTRQVGGTRRQSESPDAFRNRMDAGQTGSPATGLRMPTGNSRMDNILAARMDGSFDRKRSAYNAAGAKTGHSMDEAGNLKQQTPAETPIGQQPAAPQFASAPDGMGGNKMVTIPATPSTPTAPPMGLRKPTAPRQPGLIDGRPAAETLANLKASQSMAPRSTARNPAAPSAFTMPNVAAINSKSPLPATPAPSLESRAAALGKAMMTAKRSEEIVAKAQADSRNIAMAPHNKLNADASQNAYFLRKNKASTDAARAAIQPSTSAEQLANQIRPGVLNERRAAVAGTPTPMMPTQVPSRTVPAPQKPSMALRKPVMPIRSPQIAMVR